MYKLRDYQDDLVASVEKAFQGDLVKSALAVLPTGMGKTVCFVELARRHEGRTMIVCPMRELIHQAADKIREATGDIAAIEQASNWSDEGMYVSKYVVASKQTLTRAGKNGKRFRRFKGIGLVVVDEAHLSITPPMVEMLNHFRSEGAMILGVTATPNRLDKKSMQNVYDECTYSMTLPQAIEAGWLVGPEANVIRVKSMDLSKVAIEAGDFSVSGLNEIVEQERVELEMADVIARESVGLKTVVYCSSVNQAEKIAEILSVRYNLNARFVCADTKRCTDEERSDILGSFKNDPNGVQIVANCGVLTTGWDYPGLQHIVMARPTKSISLYTQILGRGTRPLAGVVDFPGSTPDARKLAIACSAKPSFKMTDLVDVSLKHRICSTIDALEGEIDPDLRDRLMDETIDNGPISDILQKMRDLQKRIEEEELEKKRQEAERKARAEILAEARRRKQIRMSVQYDRFGVNIAESPGVSSHHKRSKGTGPVALFGKYKGHPLAAIDTGYLTWKLNNLKLADWYKRNITNELARRKTMSAIKERSGESG